MATGKLPSSMILRLPGGPLRARLDLTLAEWALLCRVDGHRPVAALASRSGRGHHDAVALAERLLAAGLLELAGEAGADGAGADDGQGGADDAGAPRQPGAVGTGADDRPDDGDGALAAAELAGLSSADAPGEATGEDN